MPDAPVPDRPRTRLFCAVLVAAPLLEVVEALLSPLTDGTTQQDMAAIAASPSRFAVSVLFGMAGTALLLPALLGLAHRCSARTPRLALAASIAVGLLALTFFGVRGTQTVQLAMATALPVHHSAAVFDTVTAGSIGAALLITFLASNVVGVVLLGIALLRSRRVPVGSVVLLLLFPLLDLALKGGSGVLTSHAVLTIAFAWMAIGFLRAKPVRPERAPAAAVEASVPVPR